MSFLLSLKKKQPEEVDLRAVWSHYNISVLVLFENKFWLQNFYISLVIDLIKCY